MNTKQEQADAISLLHKLLHEGDEVRLILRNVSRSGMTRSISVLGPDDEQLSAPVTVALGWPFDRVRCAVKVDGTGMDMGFHLVYSLAQVILTELPLSERGYALRARWL